MRAVKPLAFIRSVFSANSGVDVLFCSIDCQSRRSKRYLKVIFFVENCFNCRVLRASALRD